MTGKRALAEIFGDCPVTSEKLLTDEFVVCPQCRQQHAADAGEHELVGAAKDTPLTIWYPGSCELCGHTGYRGRTGIYELMIVDEQIRQLIHDNQGEHALRKLARERGMRSLRTDGIARVVAGETSLAEVLRVTQV